LIISNKNIYCIQIIFELSKNYNKKLTHINDISIKHNIPRGYLVQLLNKLKNQNIIKSYRGNKGGYKLANDPAKISLLNLIETIEGGFNIFSNYNKNDAIKNIFNNVERKIKECMNISFKEILLEQEKLNKNHMYYI